MLLPSVLSVLLVKQEEVAGGPRRSPLASREHRLEVGAARSPGSPGTFEGAVVPQHLQEPLLCERTGVGGGRRDRGRDPPSKQLGWGRGGKETEMKTTEL